MYQMCVRGALIGWVDGIICRPVGDCLGGRCVGGEMEASSLLYSGLVAVVANKPNYPIGLLCTSKCACAALRPPAVGGFTLTASDMSASAPHRLRGGNRTDYPVVPDRRVT
jgi:hypothetical protein